LNRGNPTRGSAWIPALLVLLLGACVPDVDISRDTALSGHLMARTFRVRPGVVVSADRDLIVDSQGPVFIEGSVRGDIGSGASIEIRVSTGDCVVDGGLEAGSGADGEEPGEDGEAGGSVRLRADSGEIRARGALTAGAGGEGAGRREQGLGDLRVVSGAGGAGGDVEILAASVRVGAATAGDGGAGGAAFAEIVELAPGAPVIVDRGESLADEEEDGVEDQPLPASGSANALSRAGGNGGSIQIRAARLFLAPEASLRAGAGGATARASARGGKDAFSALEKPGAGGDVSMRWGALTAAATGSELIPGAGGDVSMRWGALTAAATGSELIPGAGGDAGLIGAISCAAQAHDSAAAKTAGGGEPGKAYRGGAAIESGVGGDSGNVLAQTDRDAKYDFGGSESQGAAGKPAAAQDP
jgi:hypothetical protein